MRDSGEQNVGCQRKRIDLQEKKRSSGLEGAGIMDGLK